MECEQCLTVIDFLKRVSDNVRTEDFIIRLNHSGLVPLVMEYLRNQCKSKDDYIGCWVRLQSYPPMYFRYL